MHYLGDVPARWLWCLRTWPWVALEGGRFATATTTYARSPTALALLKPAEDRVCAWEARSVDVQHALGFRTDVPGSVVLKSLRDARVREAELPLSTARAYYEHLAGQASVIPELATAFDEGLVYSPDSCRRWWRPAECLRADERGIFGRLCGYVDLYPAAYS